MIYYTYYPSPIGKLLITAEDAHLTGIWYDTARSIPSGAVSTEDAPIIRQTCRWLDCYFSGNPCETGTLFLKSQGTAFQTLVWDLLLEIPWGKTTTYGELAKLAALRMGKERMSAQAVGYAVGKNPISIVIPCHRCLGAGNALTGYAGGPDRKRFLLDLEQIQYK